MNDPRLGIFICECGDRISSILEMERLSEGSHTHPAVETVCSLRYGCSPDGIANIRAVIRKHRLDRIVVAGCTPRTILRRFREACEAAGLGDTDIEFVDIREGCAWVHADTPVEATEKALDLIHMGIARSLHRRTSTDVTVDIVPTALVLGGGISGLTAAILLAKAGVQVKLVERDSKLGGMLRQAHTLPPDHRDANAYLSQKITAAGGCENIDILLERQVTNISGSVGRYQIHAESIRAPGKAAVTFEAGVIIVATGARAQQPQDLSVSKGTRVITQSAFEHELQLASREFASRDSLPHHAVMLLSVDGKNGRQSHRNTGVAFVAALEQAIRLKTLRPESNVTILAHEFHLLNGDRYQEEFLEAQQLGVEFVFFTPAAPPHLSDESVAVQDASRDAVRHIAYDRLVLMTPLTPQHDATGVARMLKLTQDENGFFFDRRFRLRPQEHCDRGIYVCGAAHFPTDWQEAELQAANAAFHAIRRIRRGALTQRSIAAEVDVNRCSGCGTCVECCPFDAISTHKQTGIFSVAHIDPILCKACGNCVVACPTKAIDLPLESEAQIHGAINAALRVESNNGRPRILAFCCEWSGQLAADIAGARKMQYPVEIRPIHIGCSARFDPTHALWAFNNGADGILIAACRPGDCHYIDGNRHAYRRTHTLRTLLAESGFDERRLQLIWVTPDDPRDFVEKVTCFSNLIHALGTNPRSSLQASTRRE